MPFLRASVKCQLIHKEVDMPSPSTLSKQVAFLAAALDAGRVGRQDLFMFIGLNDPDPGVELEADAVIAVRHFQRVLSRRLPEISREKRSRLCSSLRIRLNNGQLTRHDFDSLFEQLIQGTGPYHGAGPFATTLAYLAAMISERRINPEDIENLCETQHTYRRRDEEQDMSTALQHVRNTLSYDWRWPTTSCQSAVRDITTKIRTGDITSNTLDAVYTRFLP